MPSLANITIKKNDGTTDIVWNGKVPSSGDKNPALWRSDAVGAAAAFRPAFSLQSQFNGPKTARRMTFDFTYPVTTVDAGGKTVVADKVIYSGSALLPMGMTDTDLAEAISQFANLMASTLVKDCFKAGYSAT